MASHTVTIYEKPLITDLSCSFLYFWKSMKTVHLAFFYVYETCMIGVFRQPGHAAIIHLNQLCAQKSLWPKSQRNMFVT